MDAARQQIVDNISSNTNILVTVSTNPSVDELSAALGLTILLNNIDKRATAIVSGDIPPAISFLQPDKTFENTADSLRDFIIALDKEKADHLRYKVEGDAVKIFITPYRTTLSDKDLEFSQGDFNVEFVIALGVTDQDHLDKGLAAHGKILHDATVATITAGPQKSSLGSIDWYDAKASSLSEMVVGLAEALKSDKNLLDEQIATAFLTGIVSATDRFSNDHTSSQVMTMAAQLMAAGANQQLIAAKLEEAHDIGPKASQQLSEDQPIGQSSGNEGNLSDGVKISRDDVVTTGTLADLEESLAPVSNDNADLVIPAFSDAPAPDQTELEKQLEESLAPVASAPLSDSSNDTLEDLQKDLQEATNGFSEEAPLPSPQQPFELPPSDSPTVPLSDATLPNFEAAPLPVLPSFDALPPQPEASTAIINEHGSRADAAIDMPPLNGTQEGVAPVEPPVDLFAGTPPLIPAPEVIQPVGEQDPFSGTPEGAALLAGEPVAPEPFIAPPIAAAPMTVPVLPPLPPLPTDSVFPPLPPPPPLPSVGPLPAPNGAVSSDQLADIFGNAAPAAPQPAPAPTEPGQFRIPGQ